MLVTASLTIIISCVKSSRVCLSRLLSAGNMNKRTAPEWKVPSPEVKVDLPPLKLFNSLSNSKVPFVPQKGKDVTWYCCGPTVYDSSHMGHARSYISFDIIRRVLVDYFGFNVKYIMNITDIDDKIIKRARQHYLISNYFESASSVAQVKQDIREAIKLLDEKSKTHPEPDQRDYLKREVIRLKILLTSRITVTSLLSGAQDALANFLDSKFGSSISDFKIFEALPRRIEKEFLGDMRSLNVLDADRLTRVSEYIDPIITFIQRIIDNGFAYSVASGSVYFNTKKFAETDGHFYAKLVPTAYGDAAKLTSGEGDLTTTETEKRNFSDFALWKASKPGEPAWPSPWGPGRPGWHIECSVMASDAIGDCMDIHTGGVDLKFPHHDNELAQSEAHFGHSHWVNYFLHAGHLTISGCKMSKSLKNFITIRDALKQHTARELRFAFLLHSWRDTLDYGADTMSEALAFSKTINDFLFNVSHTLRLLSLSKQKADGDLPENQDLTGTLAAAQKEVFDALCDSIDTQRALLAIRKLINAYNQVDCAQPLGTTSQCLTARAYQSYSLAAFILRLLCVFGASDQTALSDTWPDFGKSAQPCLAWPIPHEKAVKEITNSTLWISMDALNKEILATAFHGAAEACQMFIKEIREVASNAMQVVDIIADFEASLKRDCNFDLENLPCDVNCKYFYLKVHFFPQGYFIDGFPLKCDYVVLATKNDMKILLWEIFECSLLSKLTLVYMH
ncbi:unnamed protein product [Rodentolepis nana]|uniref:cysteine--tRNA ligase n=1 Tax=Rodentolepis nana TaxID=102285 RepID=A0A0R3T6N4_RODNA|nr:unnamed protein product [Rodentolepis nana]